MVSEENDCHFYPSVLVKAFKLFAFKKIKRDKSIAHHLPPGYMM